MDYLSGIAVLDVEATGLDVRNCAILSVGIVTHRHGRLNTFYREYYPFDGAEISGKAMEINGLDLGRIPRGRENDPRNVVVDVRSFLQGNGCATVAGQNPCVDKNYIDAYAERYGEPFRVPFGMLDLHSLCLSFMLANGIEPPRKADGSSSSLSLDKVLQFVGLDPRPGPHNALDDAELEFEALCRLIHGASAIARFADRPLPGVVSSGMRR